MSPVGNWNEESQRHLQTMMCADYFEPQLANNLPLYCSNYRNQLGFIAFSDSS